MAGANVSQLMHRNVVPGDAVEEQEHRARCTFTVDDCLDRCGSNGRFQWILLFYCGMSWACDAMEVMILSYLGPSAKCEWNLSATEESLLTSMVFLGMTLGAPVWGMVSDSVGRKTAFSLTLVCTTVFGFATAAAPSYHAMLAFRTLVGFGIPGAVVAFNLLLELTPTKMRGMFAVGIEGFWTVGTIIQAGFAYGLLNQYGWRWLVAASTVPCAILLVLLPFLPESPRYLLVKGKTDKAQQVLKRVTHVCKVEMPAGQLQPLLIGSTLRSNELLDELSGWQWVLRKAQVSSLEVWSALKQMFSPKMRYITFIFIFAWMVSAFVYYGLVTLLTHVDFVESGSKQCNNGKLYLPHEDLTGILITSSAEVPGLVFSLLMVSFVGRKVAFAVPMVLIAAVLVPLMAGVKGVGVIVCMYLSRFFIYSSFNILWAMTPEYYPTSIRNFGLGVNNSFSRIGGLLSPFAAVNARSAPWRYAPEAIFAALSLVAGSLVLLLPPDKKGKALDDCIEDVTHVPELAKRASSLFGGGGGSKRSSWPGGSSVVTGQQQHQAQQGVSASGDDASTLVEEGSAQGLLPTPCAK